jgi:GNAT superfamily N-acetyltransferase
MEAMPNQDYGLVIGTPSSSEYRRLRVAAGLSAKSAEAAERGLPNTIFGVMIQEGGRVVGMGRIVGDGGCFFQIVDVAVEPEHQGRGMGKAIVGALVKYLRRTAPPGAYVSLIADGEAHGLYSQFGFEATAPFAVGMAFTVE